MNRRNEDRQELIYPRQWRERTPSPSREPVECPEFSVLPTEAQPTVVFRDLDRDTASIQAILMLWTIVGMWTVSLYSCLVLERVRGPQPGKQISRASLPTYCFFSSATERSGAPSARRSGKVTDREYHPGIEAE